MILKMRWFGMSSLDTDGGLNEELTWYKWGIKTAWEAFQGVVCRLRTENSKYVYPV